jgi:hypothetical protein
VIELTKLTPHQRLASIPGRIPAAADAVKDVLERYAWFLQMTALPTKDLERRFSDKQKRIEMFKNATEYGDSMFRLLKSIDASQPELRLFRTVVI